MEPNLCGGDGHGAGGPGGPRPRAPASGRAFALPQVGTSSSAEEVCSSVDGFFFPRPMILVIFFPVTLDTVPLPSDLELFFLLTVKNKDNNKKACFNYRLLTGKSITIKRCRGQFSVPPVFPFEPPLHATTGTWANAVGTFPRRVCRQLSLNQARGQSGQSRLPQGRARGPRLPALTPVAVSVGSFPTPPDLTALVY